MRLRDERRVVELLASFGGCDGQRGSRKRVSSKFSLAEDVHSELDVGRYARQNGARENNVSTRGKNKEKGNSGEGGTDFLRSNSSFQFGTR